MNNLATQSFSEQMRRTKYCGSQIESHNNCCEVAYLVCSENRIANNRGGHT